MDSDLETFSQVRVKITELRRKRDQMQAEILQSRIQLQQVEEEIAALNREKGKIDLDRQDRESRVKKYNDLIQQSESAMEKMYQNTQKLREALTNAEEF